MGLPLEKAGTGYDRVEVPIDGMIRLLTKKEFEQLPLHERVDMIIGGKLKFYLDGKSITQLQALKGGY